MTNQNEVTTPTEPSDSGQWMIKITIGVEELRAIYSVVDRVHKECLFGAGVDVWLAPGGCPCLDDAPMCKITEENPILSPDEPGIDKFDTAHSLIEDALKYHDDHVYNLEQCDSAQRELMDQQPDNEDGPDEEEPYMGHDGSTCDGPVPLAYRDPNHNN